MFVLETRIVDMFFEDEWLGLVNQTFVYFDLTPIKSTRVVWTGTEQMDPFGQVFVLTTTSLQWLSLF